MKAIQITIDESMLDEIDADDETRANGRSALIRRAVRAYLRQKQAAAIDEAYRRGYESGSGDSTLGPWEEAQAWPKE